MFFFQLEELCLSSSDTEPEENSAVEKNVSQPLWQLTFFLMFWQALYRISNAAINVLLSFLAAFLRVFAVMLVSDQLQQLASKLPQSTKAARKLLWNTSKADVIEFVVCPSCHSVYSYGDCYTTRAGQKESKLCSHVAYPNHPHQHKRKKCGAVLLKRVKTRKGYKLMPIKVYPYQPLANSLGYLVQKEGFLESCEKWRHRMALIPSTHLVDVYDGRVWHDFAAFLSAPYSFLLTLNVDWFQPYSRIEYSVGAIYLTIQNLPRSERYKEENVILVGIIPGPSEPKLTINSFLAPLVKELQTAWNTGITIATRSCNTITIRLAISCVACDIPASRKTCGFLGHNATLGCNKCMKRFPNLGPGLVDYSGYERDSWELRNVHLHRQHCRNILRETTKSGMRKAESAVGVRYSRFLDLTYFDPVRFTVVDVMHNLFLGTRKHIFKL